jgi:hypothetical protein
MASCQLIIDVDVPYDGDKIVVNAVQRPDSVWAVKLQRTRYILEPPVDGYPTIDDANVSIQRSDGSQETLVSQGNGMYIGSTFPQLGDDYKVSANAPGLDPVEGAMKMPPLVKIIDVVWDSSRVTDNGVNCNCNRANVPFTITFADPAGEANYYDVTVYVYSVHTYPRYPDGELITDTLASFQMTYLRFAFFSSVEDDSVFSDRCLDGMTTTIPLVAEMLNWYGGTILKTEVRLTSSYEEFYKYNETLELQYSVMGDPFAQPVQVFSNMSNGFGIFAGTTTDVRSWRAQPE